MDLVVLDFETFYGDDYTLSKMTTEAYVRDPRFEAILCSFVVNDEKPFWVPGPDIPQALADLNIPKRAVLAHHCHFDGLILAHHYGVAPKLWFDTLGMARALHGVHGRLSLEKLAERYGIGTKGKEVENARGMRYADFGPERLARYGAYSCNDSVLAKQLMLRMAPQFSRRELMIHDRVIRMFTEPQFVLDEPMLQQYYDELRANKTTLLLQAGVQLTDIMSADKFAECLRELGIEPPLKVAPKWAKMSEAERDAWLTSGQPIPHVFAFAKTDSAMQQLQEHTDERVQVLVEARLKNKTTIAEKGAERLIGMGRRGAATIYLKYSGASGTHRLSGGDKFNWQNPQRGSPIRRSVMAPPGHKAIVVDSSTIEARILDWLAGQDDMVMVYRKQDAKTGPDMYCTIAARIYGREIVKEEHPQERQMGKVAKLGLGFGMGWERFVVAVRAQAKDDKGKPLRLDPKFGQRVVSIYRESHPQVKKLWKRGEDALGCIARGEEGVSVDFRGVVKTCRGGLVFPGGLRILYPDLKRVKIGPGNTPYDFEWEFWNGKERERIYGAKVVENIIQCLARIAVFNQCLDAAIEVEPEGARWKHSMHDEGVFIAQDFIAPWTLGVVERCFRTPPDFAPDLPVNCEGGFHQRYGLAKK